MNVFNMGILEILVILVVALVLFGPDKLIELIRMLRKAFLEFQRTANDLASAAMEQSEAAARQERAAERNEQSDLVSEREIIENKPDSRGSAPTNQDGQIR